MPDRLLCNQPLDQGVSHLMALSRLPGYLFEAMMDIPQTPQPRTCVGIGETVDTKPTTMDAQ